MMDYKLTADILRNISYGLYSAEESNLKLNWYHIIQRFGKVMNAYPEINWLNVLSRGQLDSKLWLISELEELDVELGTVFLCGGWYASLALMMFNSKLKIEKIRSFDIDDTCCKVADTMNKDFVKTWQFKASTVDIQNFEFTTHPAPDGTTGNFYYDTIQSVGATAQLRDRPDTLINTSCEHIKNFGVWYNKIPEGKLIILQSNDYFELEEHINCVKDLNDFRIQCPMNDLLYGGVIELQKYNRFMLIGIK